MNIITIILYRQASSSETKAVPKHVTFWNIFIYFLKKIVQIIHVTHGLIVQIVA